MTWNQVVKLKILHSSVRTRVFSMYPEPLLWTKYLCPSPPVWWHSSYLPGDGMRRRLGQLGLKGGSQEWDRPSPNTQRSGSGLPVLWRPRKKRPPPRQEAGCRAQPCCSLHLGFPASRTVRRKFLLFKPCSLGCFYYRSPVSWPLF